MKYNFDQKHKWRFWVWNNVVKMLKVPVEEAIVLYLPGHGDFDRKEAISRGFNPDNLIGVERDPAIIKKLRARGANVIDADIFDILNCLWLKENPFCFDVILLDLMGGLSSQVYNNVHLFCSFPNVKTPIVMLNLLRGRDNFNFEGNSFCESANTRIEEMNICLNKYEKKRPLDFLPFVVRKHLKKEPIKKHRGKQFYFILLHNKIIYSICNKKDTRFKQIKQCLSCFYSGCGFAFYSYKSDAGSMRFDTVIYKPGNINSTIRSAGTLEVDSRFDKLVTNRIAAAKAIRTARLNKIA